MHTQYTYTQNKYNTAICTYIAVALGTAATTVLMVWSLVWSRDSILFYVSWSKYCAQSHNIQKNVSRVATSHSTRPLLVEKLWTPWMLEIMPTAMHINLMSHAVSCWLATTLSRVIICLHIWHTIYEVLKWLSTKSIVVVDCICLGVDQGSYLFKKGWAVWRFQTLFLVIFTLLYLSLYNSEFTISVVLLTLCWNRSSKYIHHLHWQ